MLVASPDHRRRVQHTAQRSPVAVAVTSRSAVPGSRCCHTPPRAGLWAAQARSRRALAPAGNVVSTIRHTARRGQLSREQAEASPGRRRWSRRGGTAELLRVKAFYGCYARYAEHEFAGGWRCLHCSMASAGNECIAVVSTPPAVS